MTTIHVSSADDWSQISRLQGPVVDPLILRCGELFLRGATNAPGAWELLQQNIWAVGTFFDRLVLDDAIPVFDYPFSFDSGQNFEARTLAQVNEVEEILVDVQIGAGVYQPAKDAALKELSRLFEEGRGVAASDAAAIVGELSASGYAWYPNLDGLSLGSDQEMRLASYILGGLIFGTYAQQSGADHLMQPKRSRLFLALSLGHDTGRSAEATLFDRFRAFAGSAAQDVPYTPTFFPLILAGSDGPRSALRKALELRASSEARDYRSWLRAALDDFANRGRIGVERETEIDRIASAIERRVGSNAPKVDVKMTVADAGALAAGMPPTVGVDLTRPVMAAWGWVIDSLPGNRHRKLLSRAIVAEHEYPRLERLVQTVWSGPSF